MFDSNPPPDSRTSRRRGLLAAAAGGLWAISGMPALAAAASKGELIALPSFELVDGGRLDAADWKGRGAIIVFWSTDCAYCKRHNARLEKLYRATRERGSDLQILGIATDDNAQTVRAHMATNDFHFPVALDPGAIRSRLTDRKVVPMTVLIDRGGRLLLAIPGEMSEDDLLAAGKQLG